MLLQTLPGWPPAQDPTVLQSLGLLIGLPLVVIVIVALVAKVGTLAQAGRGGATPVTDPVWLGGRDQTVMEGGTATGPDRAAIEGSPSAPEGSAADGAAGVGGASARW